MGTTSHCPYCTKENTLEEIAAQCDCGARCIEHNRLKGESSSPVWVWYPPPRERFAEFPCTVVVSGARAVHDDYFRISGENGIYSPKHNPLIVLDNSEGRRLNVNILSNPRDAFAYTDDTLVIGQWRGMWRSDFFVFTVAHVREGLKGLKGFRELEKETSRP